MYQFTFTARYWNEDSADDFSGTVWANSEFDARCHVEDIHPEANVILITEN